MLLGITMWRQNLTLVFTALPFNTIYVRSNEASVTPCLVRIEWLFEDGGTILRLKFKVCMRHRVCDSINLEYFVDHHLRLIPSLAVTTSLYWLPHKLRFLHFIPARVVRHTFPPSLQKVVLTNVNSLSIISVYCRKVQLRFGHTSQHKLLFTRTIFWC